MALYAVIGMASSQIAAQNQRFRRHGTAFQNLTEKALAAYRYDLRVHVAAKSTGIYPGRMRSKNPPITRVA